MDSSVVLDDLVGQFLAEAKDDLIGLWEIAREVRQRAGSGDDAREEALAVVRQLLSRGLLVEDPPYAAAGYRPWTDQDPDRAIARIRKEWLALGRMPDIPDIAWFGRKH